MTTKKIRFPPKLVNAFQKPLGTYRNLVLYGGRGSGKSYSVALMVAIWGAQQSLRILCTREFQNSIKESFHAELKKAINKHEFLKNQYIIGVDFLRHKFNGTEFIFKGLRSNITAIKSMAQINLVIVEEAETVPHSSWLDLVPTIREKNSSFIVIFNPKHKNSYVAERFILCDELPPRTKVIKLNYLDNPDFPEILEEQRQHDKKVLDPALYSHIWEGAFYEQSEAQVFNKKYIIEDFEPSKNWNGPYFGLDFGFANDPTACIKCYVFENRLYIMNEVYEKRLELDDTAKAVLLEIEDASKYVIRADSARPESISYLKRHGLPRIESVKKWAGSVEDGITFMKSFDKIVIHSRCKNVINEFNLYSYKVDRLSGDITSTIVDAYNHAIDAIRYALTPLIKNTQSMLTKKRIK